MTQPSFDVVASSRAHAALRDPDAAARATPSLGQALRRAVTLRGADTAVIDGEKRFSWLDFADRVRRLAAAFAANGLEPDGRVAMLALNSHRSLEAFFATIWSGGAIVPLNHRLSQRELSELIADCKPDFVLVGDEFGSMIPDLIANAGDARFVLTNSAAGSCGALSYEAMIEGAEPGDDAGRSGDDLAMILYTSGTTGSPKGVMLSHSNIAANTANTVAEIGLGVETVHLHHGPLFHVAAAARIFSVTQAGGTHVVLPRFVAAEVISAISKFNVTHATFVPTMIRSLLDAPELAGADLSSLRIISYGSAPMQEALIDEMLRALPDVGFLQSYGMTELSPVVTILGPRDHRPETRDSGVLRSAGRPVLFSEVRVISPEGATLNPGEVGEIVARGPNVMLGYWNRPDLTAEALRGGWMHTGDAGYFDDRGYLFVVDRLKDMIITGGENVFSQEVENIIATHPAVAECAVIGLPDSHWGETVNAVVSLRSGAEASPQDIIDHCRVRLAGFKCPKAVYLRHEPMPLSGANKILKSKLREEVMQLRGAST